MKKGNILYADPTLNNDLNFSRSVVILVEENNVGYVGFIINKKSIYSTLDLIPEIKENFEIFDGGPVEKENLYFIHNVPDLIKNSIEIKDNLYWGGNFEHVVELINKKKIKKNNIKFFLGYSGWNKDQLLNELETKSWIIREDEKLDEKTFNNSIYLWKDKLIELGGEYLIWSNSPDNPQHN